MKSSMKSGRALRIYDRKPLRLYLALTAVYCSIVGIGQLYPQLNSEVQYNSFIQPELATGLGFLLCGIILGLRSLRQMLASVIGGFFVEILSIVPLAMFAFGSLDTHTTVPAIAALLSFLLIAISVQFVGYRGAFRLRSAFVAMAGSTVMAYGLIGMAKSLADFDTTSSLHSIGFALMGGYLLFAAWYDPVRSLRPLWFNIAVGSGSVTANIVLWQGLANLPAGPDGFTGTATAVLYAGLLATVCLTVVAHFAQTANAQAKKMALMNNELLEAYDATLAGWARALELRDSETLNHTSRVTELTLLMAHRFQLSDDKLPHIRRGALLHDIGKIGIPDSILLKRGPLNPDEWTVMKQHPMYAYDLLKTVSYLRPALDIPRYHHEKWDGTGYPDGLAGDRIPFAARMFAVIDIWDALTHQRPYRDAWSIDKVKGHIRQLSGTHLDPEVVDVFLDLIDSDNAANVQVLAASRN